jgi:hypothetical protein
MRRSPSLIHMQTTPLVEFLLSTPNACLPKPAATSSPVLLHHSLGNTLSNIHRRRAPPFRAPPSQFTPTQFFHLGLLQLPFQSPAPAKTFPFHGLPPEVAALLSAQSSGRAVSPILARDSPLVRWELPSAIGYFWLGFFWISAVKVIFMSAYLSEKTISIHRESFFSFPRWKHVYGKKVARRRRRRPSRCNVPGAFFWNGCPEARTSSRTSGHISCRRGGNRSIPSSSQTNNPCSSHLRVTQALLLYPNGPISQSRAQSPGILPCYYRSLSSRPSPRPLPRPVLSPQAIIAHHVVASTCSAFFDIVFVRVPRATQG